MQLLQASSLTSSLESAGLTASLGGAMQRSVGKKNMAAMRGGPRAQIVIEEHSSKVTEQETAEIGEHLASHEFQSE